jgi:hypothetical protein
LALAATIVADACQQNRVQTGSNNGVTDEKADCAEAINRDDYCDVNACCDKRTLERFMKGHLRKLQTDKLPTPSA